MRAPDTAQRLIEHLAGRFSEAELRQAVRRELPDFVPDLPGAPCSPRELAVRLVQLAERRGYLPEVALAVLVKETRARPSRLLLLGAAALACAGAALVASEAMRSKPPEETVHDEAPTLAAPEPDLVASSPAPAPSTSRASSPRPSGGARRAAKPTPVHAPEEPASKQPDLADEARSGPARCHRGVCRLGADLGRFWRREEFCVLPADGAGAERCILRGDLVQPAATVQCDLSKIYAAPLDGEFRWENCDAS